MRVFQGVEEKIHQGMREMLTGRWEKPGQGRPVRNQISSENSEFNGMREKDPGAKERAAGRGRRGKDADRWKRRGGMG